MSDIAQIRAVADGCRRGLERLANQRGSMFCTFPSAACGPAAEIVGRILKEELGLEGVYVCGDGHPDLSPAQSHAWFEVERFIVDITYDQFQGTGLSGWVFEHGSDWHSRFSDLDRRDGFCMPNGWPYYPFDGYRLALEEVQKPGGT